MELRITGQPTQGLSSLVGLDELKRLAARDIQASLRTGEIFPHTLLTGLGGLGKTTFTERIAYDLRYWFTMIEGAMCKTRRQIQERLIAACYTARDNKRRLLFFIDEVHRLAHEPQEALYYPLLYGTIPDYGKLHPFSLFVATTHPHMLLGPFQNRIVNRWHFSRYEQDTISHMIVKFWVDKKLSYEPGTESLVSARAFGIPRNGYNLASKIRNEVIARGGSKIVTPTDCHRTFVLEGIDDIGLNRDQLKYLRVVSASHGSPIGLGGIAGKMDCDAVVVEESIEPVLLSLGFVDRTPKGRILTPAGRQHLSKSCTA